MQRSRPVWRALRPVLLAAAATTAWAALSASAASADSSHDAIHAHEQAPSHVTRSATPVAALSQDLQAPLHSLPPALPDLSSAVPGLRPVTHDVTVTAEQLPASVPDVKTVAPVPSLTPVTGAVMTKIDSTLSAMAGEADRAVSRIVTTVDKAVLPVVDAAVPQIVRTTVTPVVSPVAGVRPVTSPSSLQGVKAATAPAASASGFAVPRGGPIQEFGSQAGTPEARALTNVGPTASVPGMAVAFLPCPHKSLRHPDSVAPADPVLPGSNTKNPTPAPTGLLGNSSATGGNSGGNFHSPWISSFHINLPGHQNVPPNGVLMQAPAPVSFDPGSSPD